MRLLTLTPEAHVYVVATIVVLSLASGSAAIQAQGLWPPARRPPFLVVYVLTMAAVAAAGLALLTVPSAWVSSPQTLGLSVFAGLVAGAGAWRCDSALRRELQRRERHPTEVLPRPALVSSRPLGPAQAAMRTATVPTTGLSTLALLLAVALLEEILYRGVVVDLSLQLSSRALAALCITASVAAFAAAHVYAGWPETLAKIPLGVAALFASLPFHAVAGAIAAHMVFNARSWFAARATAPTSFPVA
jgi:hypothetical protein